MTPLQQRLAELERMDESIYFKHLPRKAWPKELIKNKVLLWQVPRTTGTLLAKLVAKTRPKCILELGTSAGYSGLWMLEAYEGAILHTIEFSPYRFALAQESFLCAGMSKRVIQYNAKIREVLASWEKKIDFLFIDADKLSYLEYFQKLEPFLRENAVVVVDNMLDSREKTDNLLTYVRKSGKYAVDVLPIDNGLVVIKVAK